MTRCGRAERCSLPRRTTGARRSAAFCETPMATWWRSASQQAPDSGRRVNPRFMDRRPAAPLGWLGGPMSRVAVAIKDFDVSQAQLLDQLSLQLGSVRLIREVERYNLAIAADCVVVDQ